MKKFFTQKVVKHWNVLPRESVGAPSLQVLNARFDGAFSSLIMSGIPAVVGVLELDDL